MMTSARCIPNCTNTCNRIPSCQHDVAFYRPCTTRYDAMRRMGGQMPIGNTDDPNQSKQLGFIQCNRHPNLEGKWMRSSIMRTCTVLYRTSLLLFVRVWYKYYCTIVWVALVGRPTNDGKLFLSLDRTTSNSSRLDPNIYHASKRRRHWLPVQWLSILSKHAWKTNLLAQSVLYTNYNNT